MDNLDHRIIDLLRLNSRSGYGDIGVRVGLSASAVKRRVDRLVADGTIRAFTIQVDPTVDGLIARTLAKRPEDRFASVGALITALLTSATRSFQGRFDGVQLDERPESILPARPRHGSRFVDALRGLNRRRALSVLGLLVVLLVPTLILFGVQRWTVDEPVIADVEAVPAPTIADSPAGVAAPSVEVSSVVPAAAQSQQSHRTITPDLVELTPAPTAMSTGGVVIEKQPSGKSDVKKISSKKTPKSTPSRPSKPEVPSTSQPEVLSTAEIQKGANRVSARAQACGALHGKARLWKAGVSIRIDGATGVVTSATALYPDTGTPFGKCVEAVLKSATFKKFRQANMTEKVYVTM